MRASRLLALVPALVSLGSLVAAEKPTALIDRVVPTYGVRHDTPFRVPSRVETQVSQARAFLSDLNTKLLTRGAGTAELGAIARWQQDLDKLTQELVPAASLSERQQLDGVYAELDRAVESIALLTATVPPPAPRIEAAAPAKAEEPTAAAPAVEAPGVEAPAVVPEAAAPAETAPEAPAPVIEAVAPMVEAPGVEAPGVEAPGVEAPGVEAPAVEAPAETPAAEAPAAMEPAEAPAEVPAVAPAEAPAEAPAPALDAAAPATDAMAPAVDAAAPAVDATAPAVDATAPAADPMAPADP